MAASDQPGTECRCVYLSGPVDTQNTVLLCDCCASTSNPPEPEPSPVKVHVNVQLESIIDTETLLAQMKQEINQAVEEIVLLNEHEMELRKVELACHQVILQEIQKLAKAARTGLAAPQDSPSPLNSRPLFNQESSSNGLSVKEICKDVPPPFSRSVPREAMDQDEIHVVEWDPRTQEQVQAQSGLPWVSASMTFLYLY